MKEEYYDYYEVKMGDTLYKIGRKYNINPKLLAALNGLNMDDYIYPNDTILIPKSNYSYYITAKGDTLDEIIRVFDTSLDRFLNNNKTIYLMEGQLLVNKKN
jgi:LysM repeat protein